MRGIAALLVCCFHSREDLNLGNLLIGNFLFGKGSVGVPVFFVISGFIMAFTTQKIRFGESLRNLEELSLFYRKRIIRIVPLYYILTFAWILLGGTWLFYFGDGGLSRLLHSLLFLPQKDVLPVLYLGWSLNYEMFFYFIFGISLLFREKRYFFIVVFFLFTYLLGRFITTENAFLLMIMNTLNLYFVIGILSALFLNKFYVPKKIATFISTAGILLFTLMLLGLINVNHELMMLSIVSLFVFSFLLFDYSLKLKGNRALIFVGDISYSLYLSHPFVEIILRKIKPEGWLNIPFFIFKILLSIGFAAIIYFYVEKKLSHYLKIKLKA
ncbi:MAG: acyltransferase [Weeksellaceae bacterium]|nr:acyltransferase [Weeksellaceae bacterium]